MTSYVTSKQAAGINYRSNQGHPREASPKMHPPRGHQKTGGAFVFRRRTQPIDWRLLAGVDIDRIQDELDFVCLQQNLLHITFCNIDSEIDIKYSDHNLVKLFKLSQLISEYLLHSQEYLTETINFLETKNSKLTQINSTLQIELGKREDEICELKKDNKSKKSLIKELQAKVVSGAQNYFPCSRCEKSFMSDYFLQNHIQRRHPDYVTTMSQSQHQTSTISSSKVTELEKEITHLKERLNSTELSLEKATRSESFMKDQFQEILLRNVSLANMSDGQLLRSTTQTTGAAEQSVNEKIMRQLSDLQAKYSESQLALAEAIRQKQAAVPDDSSVNVSLRLQDRIKQLEIENESKRIQLERLQRPEVFGQMVTPEKPKKRITPQSHSTPKEKPSVNKYHGLEIQREEMVAPVKPERKLQSEVNLGVKKGQPGVMRSPHDEIDAAVDMLDESSSGESFEGEDDLDVAVPRYSQSIRLTRALKKDPDLLSKLRPEMEDILALELEKLGISRATTGISTKTLNAKLKLIQRQSNTQNYENISELKKEYEADVTEIAKKQLSLQGPFKASLSGKTAKNLSTSMVEAGKGGAKDPLEFQKRSPKTEKTKIQENIEVSTPKATTSNLSLISSMNAQQDEVDDLVQEFLNDTHSSESSLTPRQPSPRKQVSKVGTSEGASDHVDAGINLEAAGVSKSPVVFKAKKAPVPDKPTTGTKKIELGPKGDGDKKFVPQTNGLVNGAAKAGTVATSTLFDSGDEQSDWDESIEMINMEPGSKPTPQPRASMTPQVAMGTKGAAANTSLSGTTSIQSAANNLETKLASRPVGMSKPAGSVDVGLGLSGHNPVTSSTQKSVTSAAIVDSDSEPFTEDDFSKNGSSHGGITVLGGGGKPGQPTPILSSTLKTEASPTAVIKTPTYTATKPTVSASVKGPGGHKDSFVSVTSFDSEEISDFDL